MAGNVQHRAGKEGPIPVITATVVISFLSFFTLGLPDGLLGVAWPTVRGEFGQPVGAIAFLLASGSMGYLLSSTSIGRIIRRIGLANAIVGGSASIAMGLALIATAVSWWFILPGYFLIGFGGGLVDAGFNAYAADHFDATTMNWMHACFGIGATVGPSMMTFSLLRTGSWRPAYLVSSLFIVLVTALILRFRHRISGAAGGTRHPTEPVAPPAGHDLPASATADIDREGDLPAGRDPRWLSTWGGVAVFFLYTGIEVSTGQLGFTLLVEGRGVDPVRAGFWVSAFWLALTVGRILLGPLSHRVGSRRVLRGAFALAVTAALLLMLNLHPTLDGLSLALMGFALASIFPLMTLLTSERVGAARAHDVIGYQMGAATVGVVLLSGGGGVLAGRFGVALIGPYIFVLTLL
ncbi:MAG: MFS transporter, partial [Spirochaetaceae bacterium]